MSGETKTPVLRFPDSAPWKDQRLGAFGKPFNGLNGKTKADFGHGEGRYVTYLGIFTNAIVNRGHCASVEIDSSQNNVRKGDVFFTTSSETPDEVGMSAVWMDEVPNTYLNSFCFGFRPDGNNDSEFLAYLFRSPVFRNNMAFLAQGISRYNISKGKVMDIMVSLPSSTSEQQSIGGFFRELDALIAEREKALGKLESLKKAMLEKMFPQGDAKVPEVRFKGFEGEWEEKKLGECGSCQSGEGFPEIEQGGKRGIPFFKVSDMNLPGNESELIRANNYVTEEQIRKCLWHPVEVLPAVFFAKVGAAVMLNRKRLVKNRFLLDNNTMAFRLKTCIYPDFAKALFDTIDLPALSQTGALPSIGAGNVEELQRRIPSIPEQQAIGSFFRSLDALLAARREEAEKLKQLKKAFLERMFA